MKRRLNGTEYSIEEIIFKIVGKCTEATSIYFRVAFGLRELYLIKNWLQRADALGLWNNRLDFLISGTRTWWRTCGGCSLRNDRV